MFELDTVQIVEDRLLKFDLDDITVQVSGGKFYEVDAFVTYKISDAARFRGQVSGRIELAEQRLRTRLDNSLAPGLTVFAVLKRLSRKSVRR